MITVVKISLIKLCSLPPGIIIFVKLYFVLDVSFLVIFRSYGKIPKIGPGAYIFQRSFFRGSFLENLIFGGAYLVNIPLPAAGISADNVCG